MVSNLPHVAVRLQAGSAEGSQREALLMVDLGASGSEIIFHSRAVQELGLQDLPQSKRTQLKVCGPVLSWLDHSSRVPLLAAYEKVSCQGRSFKKKTVTGLTLQQSACGYEMQCKV